MNLPLPPSAATSATHPLAPVGPAAAVTAVVPAAGTAPVAPVAPAAGAAPVAAAAPVAPTAPPTPALSLSAHAQQALRLQVFQTLIAQLVTQVQSSNPAMAPQWPTNGVPPALREMLSTLIAQATAGLPQPQQLVAVQPWPQAWLNTVLPAPAAALALAGNGDAAPPATPMPGAGANGNAAAVPPAITLPGAGANGNAAAALPLATLLGAGPTGNAVATPLATLAGAGATGNAAARGESTAGMPLAAGPATTTPGAAPRLPPMLTWLVQQGVVQAPDGERGFALTLQVPQAWAQMQAMPVALAATPGAALLPTPAAGQNPLQLPLAVPAQPLESGALALVLQGTGGDRMRTSALLWLDFQPLPLGAQGASSAAALAGLLPSAQMAQQALATLQAKNDPWLQMAALQASGQRPREDERIEEQRTGLCTEMGCPYRGKASCAQPFCAEMNRVWAAVRVGAN
ncbi:MAG: Fe-S oxidoreductase [Comamonas sp.]